MKVMVGWDEGYGKVTKPLKTSSLGMGGLGGEERIIFFMREGRKVDNI